MYSTIGARFDSLPSAIYNERENMEAILKFALPDDKTEFEAATKSMDWAILAWDLDQMVRKLVKYHPEEYDTKTLDHIREEIHNIMEEKGLQFPP